jgi:hypothetical protein
MTRTKPTIANLVIAVPIVAVMALLGIINRPPSALPTSVSLNVPYVSQIPDGKWVAPWDEACEEAAITMVDTFYRGNTSISPLATKQIMLDLFAWENEVLKKNYDTDASETLQLIRKKTSFVAAIKRNPLLQDIKRELAAGHPVIFLHNMYKLYGERNLGDSYHVSVITGYDDATSEFTIHDPARAASKYSYEILMNSLHDYNAQTREADGVPTAIFTSQP